MESATLEIRKYTMARMADMWNLDKATAVLTKMEVGKLRTRAAK